jgi:hypothetical protein
MSLGAETLDVVSLPAADVTSEDHTKTTHRTATDSNVP